jgi:hypothetical protein
LDYRIEKLKPFIGETVMTIKKKKLNEKAMLAHFQISCWTGRTKDSKVSQEVTLTKNADGDAGAWWTYLVPKKALREVYRTAAICRSTHWKFTLPWQDGGCRILPSAMYLDYKAAMREVVNNFDEAVGDFIKHYPTIMGESQKRLGKLSQNKKLPSASTLKTKFGHRGDLFPLPVVADFRIDLADETADLQKQMEASINSITTKAMSSVWERLHELVDKIEETLKEPKKIFRDTLISNLKDFCELLPKLNITDDSNLEAMRKEAVSKLTQLKPGNLRDSKTDRRKASKDAKDFLAKMKSYTNQ